MHALIRSSVVLMAVVACGCASTMQTSSLPADVPATTEVDGIPYREREQLQVELYELGPDGYELRDTRTALLANPTVVHVQNFKGQSFADSSLKVVQRTDGSLASVTLTGDSKAAEAMTNFGDGVTAAQTAKKARDDAEKARKAELKAERQAELDAAKAKDAAAVQAIYDTTKARGEARVLELEYSQLSADTSASEREAKRNAMVLAKLRANTAAVAAGQPIPYPDPEG